MNWSAVIITLFFCVNAAMADKPTLKQFQWKKTGDSIRMEFGFNDATRPKYRIRSCNELVEKPCLHVEFSGATLGERALKNRPDWIEEVLRSDSSILDLRIALTQASPWRYSWEGKILRVDILDRTPKKSAWKNPWMIGSVGAGLLAGGVAIWLGSESPSTTPNSSNVIPPPDVVLPP